MHDEADDDRQTSGLLADADRDEAYLDRLKSREKEEQAIAQSIENEALDPTWNGGIDFIDDLEIL